VASGLLSAGKDSLETNEPRKFPLINILQAIATKWLKQQRK